MDDPQRIRQITRLIADGTGHTAEEVQFLVVLAVATGILAGAAAVYVQGSVRLREFLREGWPRRRSAISPVECQWAQRPAARRSRRSFSVMAASISARWVNAWGKLPICSPVGAISSEYRPRWLA